MTEQDEKQLWMEIEHIYKSGTKSGVKLDLIVNKHNRT